MKLITPKTLLLNSSYEVISFINYKKSINLLIKEKVDVVSKWNYNIPYTSGYIELPSILKLKYYLKRHNYSSKFNRYTLFKRDCYRCQYCNIEFSYNELTIDHVIPRAKGGKSVWENCVTACNPCNLRKGSMSLQECGMRLLKQPSAPKGNLVENEYFLLNLKHKDWEYYFI